MVIAGIINDSICDGVGFRDVVFVSGCPWNCIGCHNRKAQNENYGTYYSVNELAYILGKSENDITISGGDPLTFQGEETVELVKQLKIKYNKNIWLYTGYLYEEIVENNKLLEVLYYIDVLVDGKFDSDIRKINPNPRFRGSENQRIIDVKQSLIKNKIVIWDGTRDDVFPNYDT